MIAYRGALLEDVPALVALECGWESFEFRGAVACKHVMPLVAYLPGGEIVAYLFYEIHKKKLEVIRFYVHPAWRRCGIGTVMMNAAKQTGDTCRSRVAVSVPESFLDVQLFLKAMGFTASRVERGQFGDEDGYRFVHRANKEVRAA